MSDRLEILKRLFWDHFTHEDFLIEEQSKLSSDEAMELFNFYRKHPHVKKINELSSEILERTKKSINEGII